MNGLGYLVNGLGAAMQEQDKGKGKAPPSPMEAVMAQEEKHLQAASRAFGELFNAPAHQWQRNMPPFSTPQRMSHVCALAVGMLMTFTTVQLASVQPGSHAACSLSNPQTDAAAQ